MRKRRAVGLLWAVLVAVIGPAAAGSFERYHPDQFNFGLAMERVVEGNEAGAIEYFRRAARYADKPSQMALALLLFEGRGVARDRALAYAWSDLAAERGYPAFLGVRERIWAALDAAEQERAIREGEALYAEYGDAVAKPRLERLLLQGRAGKTGSRSGAGGSSRLGVAQLGGGGAQAAFKAAFFSSSTNLDDPTSVMRAFGKGVGAAGGSGDNLGNASYYDASNWEPVAYWATRDAVWLDLGTVEVKPLEPVGEATPR